MKKTIADSIKNDLGIEGPYVLVRANQFLHLNLYEVLGQSGEQHGNWYLTFNGNSKQRRQQRRKLLREANRA